MSRDRTVCLMRVRNEERWIRRSLETTLKVAKTVVLFDDGSTDETVNEALHVGDDDSVILIESVFREPDPVRTKEVVNEVRDKNVLWSYAKANVDFDYVLCLDGDEVLSKQAIDGFPFVWALLDDKFDVVSLPFVYLWDSETQRRIDGIYGNNADGQPGIRHSRIFTIKRFTPEELYDIYFARDGSGGGFHCGSIPATRAERGARLRGGEGRRTIFAPLPIIHLGYLDIVERTRKFEFYTSVDPGNVSEGEYKHIIGQPSIHAPGPVQLVPWNDGAAPVHTKINVGAGGRPMAGYLNTDVHAKLGIELVCPAWQIGVENESMEELQCHQMIEHVFPRDWPNVLNEFWRVLKPNSTMVLSTPDFGDIAAGYCDGRYTIDDVRKTVMATCPPFNSCDYDDPASYHRTAHSKASLTEDLMRRGFIDIESYWEGLSWNMFVKARKPGRFNVMVPQIRGFIHTEALREVAESVHYGLKALGHDSVLTSELFVAMRQSIVFGVDRLAQNGTMPPAGSIVYNLEQYGWCLNLDALKPYEVWDYSLANVEKLKAAGVRAKHVPIGYVPELSRIELEESTTDVLFYGCMSERRAKIIEGLKAAGLSVTTLESVYGVERDRNIAQAKIVLNMHYADEPAIFEVVRVSYLLANKVCVVSERGVGYEPFEKAAFFCDYDQLVDTCVSALQDDIQAVQRNGWRIGNVGFDCMKSFDEKAFLKEALKR